MRSTASWKICLSWHVFCTRVGNTSVPVQLGHRNTVVLTPQEFCEKKLLRILVPLGSLFVYVSWNLVASSYHTKLQSPPCSMQYSHIISWKDSSYACLSNWDLKSHTCHQTTLCFRYQNLDSIPAALAFPRYQWVFMPLYNSAVCCQPKIISPFCPSH